MNKHLLPLRICNAKEVSISIYNPLKASISGSKFRITDADTRNIRIINADKNNERKIG